MLTNLIKFSTPNKNKRTGGFDAILTMYVCEHLYMCMLLLLEICALEKIAQICLSKAVTLISLLLYMYFCVRMRLYCQTVRINFMRHRRFTTLSARAAANEFPKGILMQPNHSMSFRFISMTRQNSKRQFWG